MNEKKSLIYTRVFLGIFIALFLVGALISPTKKLLTEFGIIEAEDRANYIDPTVHEGPFAEALNAISFVQAQVDDTYINYIPFYNAIVDGIVEIKHNLNQAFTQWLGEMAKKPPVQDTVGNTSSHTSQGQSTQSGTTSSQLDTNSYPMGGIGSVENAGGAHQEGRPNTSQTTSDTSSKPTTSTPQVSKPTNVGVTANFIKTKGSYSFFTYDFLTPSGKSGHFLDKLITSKQSHTTSPSIAGAQKMNRLAKTVPNVNVYIYLCTRISETSLRNDCMGSYKGGTKENLNAFLNELDSSIGRDYFKMDTLEDRISKVYLTDHHWNAKGLDEAYGEIISMMKKKAPTIPAKRNGTYYTVKPKYYGTYVNDMTSLFNVKDYCEENNLYDVFDFYDYSLPTHSQTGGVKFSTSKAKYLASSFTGAGVKDFYNDFYQSASYYNYPSNNTGRNLLVLGDSFSVSVNELLASHFDETYFIDIRSISSENPLNLKSFCSLNGVTDVLILQNSYQLMYLETAGNWGNVQ